MDLAALTSNTSIEKLKCAQCKNYLSHFPIRICSNNQNICGRCIAPEEHVFQNVAFETLSQFLRFPCCFRDEGCEEELQPKSVPQHEKTCFYRIILCPTRKFSGCEWKGSRRSLLHHCQTEHENICVRNGELQVGCGDTEDGHFLVVHDKLILIFKRRFDPRRKLLLFEMYTNEFELQVKKFSCQLVANNNNKSLSMVFTTTTFEEVVTNELSLEPVMATNVSLKLTIGNVVEDPKTAINLDMLSLLKCFICSDYAIPPIYHCVGNTNTLCSDCKMTHESSCNSCLRNNSSTRNINLDKMANLLNYPCKYRQNGCLHVSKPELIKKHQMGCELGDFNCPVNEFETCPWKGPWKELEKHVQNNHQELVTNSAQISKQLLPQRMKCDIIKFSNQLFRLVTLRTPDEKYLWTVQIIGSQNDNFKYEIEILDPVGKGRRLLVRQQVGALTKRDRLFKETDKFCYFLKDQIRDFVVEQVVTFRVHIFI